ncbi:hypothetical protein ACQUY5_16545 [Bacillus cereus]|uniref:hypothetical protein n=1 Tax=Bacillus cereus TaxID=1396 RepID=UPI003D17E407
MELAGKSVDIRELNSKEEVVAQFNFKEVRNYLINCKEETDYALFGDAPTIKLNDDITLYLADSIEVELQTHDTIKFTFYYEDERANRITIAEVVLKPNNQLELKIIK